MGTRVTVVAPEAHADEAVAVVQALFVRWECRFSRFLPDSELSLLNRAAGRPVPVSRLMARVLGVALDAARGTAGLFDPSLGLSIVAAGYDRPFGGLAGEGPAPRFRPGGGWREIDLDPVARTVTVPEGVAIDLGGIAKGLAVDASLRMLDGLGVPTALVEAGGDLAVLNAPPGGAWPVEIREAPGTPVVSLLRGALATSTTARRFWMRGGRPLHHILEPATGRPSETGLRAVTVAADRCGQAEVAATAAMLLGPRRAAEFLELQGLPGLLVLHDGGCVPVAGWRGTEVA